MAYPTYFNPNQFVQQYQGYPQVTPSISAAQPLNTPQQVPQQGFICRPVTSRAEAEVFQIPFDGSTTYFVDTANGKIYAKTFNLNTGAAPIVTFVPEAAAPAVQYATIDDLNALREELISKPKKAVKKDDSDE